MTLPNAAPKPQPRTDADKRAARIAQLQKLRASRKPIPRTPLKKKARPASAKAKGLVIARRAIREQRKAKRFACCFHSVERVEFVKTLPCCVTGYRHTDYDPIDNAHVYKDESKGLSRRAGYRCIAPMKHSVHMLLHQRPDLFRQRFPLADAAWFEQAAALTEKLWLQSGLVRVDG